MLGGPRPGLGRRGRAAPRDRCPALGRSPRGASARALAAVSSRSAEVPPTPSPRSTLSRFLPPLLGMPHPSCTAPAGSAAVPGFGIPAGSPGVVTQHSGTHRRLAADRKIKRGALSAAPRAAAGRGDGVGIHVRGKKGGTELERERRV